jgi:hypothetical protein
VERVGEAGATTFCGGQDTVTGQEQALDLLDILRVQVVNSHAPKIGADVHNDPGSPVGLAPREGQNQPLGELPFGNRERHVWRFNRGHNPQHRDPSDFEVSDGGAEAPPELSTIWVPRVGVGDTLGVVPVSLFHHLVDELGFEHLCSLLPPYLWAETHRTLNRHFRFRAAFGISRSVTAS